MAARVVRLLVAGRWQAMRTARVYANEGLRLWQLLNYIYQQMPFQRETQKWGTWNEGAWNNLCL